MGIYLDDKEKEELELTREYGTTDKKKIEKIKKDRKESRKVGCFIIFLLFVLPVFLMGLVQKCTGSKSPDIFNNSAPWEPRHTYIQKPL